VISSPPDLPGLAPGGRLSPRAWGKFERHFWGSSLRYRQHQGELYPRVGFIVTNLTRPNERVVKFYNGRGTAEQWIREGKNAIRWTRLSCHAFRHNAVRLQLHALAYNLANFMRTLALPEEVEHWSLTTLREKLAKIGARIVRHGRYVVFQLAEVAVPRALFAEILRRIDRLRPSPPPLLA
jgi:Transposase DDE domain group 1